MIFTSRNAQTIKHGIAGAPVSSHLASHANNAPMPEGGGTSDEHVIIHTVTAATIVRIARTLRRLLLMPYRNKWGQIPISKSRTIPPGAVIFVKNPLSSVTGGPAGPEREDNAVMTLIKTLLRNGNNVPTNITRVIIKSR